MDKRNIKYMRLGKKVACNGNRYKLIEDMDEKSLHVKGVEENKLKRFERLRAWSINDVGLTKEEREEYENIPVLLEVDQCIPINKIRFFDTNYQPVFEVNDFSKVMIGEKIYTAVYIDDYHLYLIGENGCENCLHVFELADFLARNELSCKIV